ncbi:MAG: hypothetical protein HEQ10_06325 [Dolichospermum sp. DEX182a]|nr:hypothetical protein [Dolichospermum sp. DEX182a]QSV61484.1 MAG: hypothetical protein HEQ26_00630 [Dolichospermum sp. DL01]
MPGQIISSKLLTELSAEEQEVLAGGYRWCRRPYKPYYGYGVGLDNNGYPYRRRPYYGSGDGRGSPYYRC